jgi:CheY-like chemotaxis protein
VDELRRRARILVVDDQEFAYLSLFRRDGYNVDKWEDVVDLQKLESGYYDLILLDIQGVGREHSADQGLGILKHLHRAAPAQIVIAYSNADWSLKYQAFFSMADAVLAKGKDYVEFKRTVDTLILRRFSLEFYVEKVVSLLGEDIQDHAKLRDVARRSILKNAPVKLSDYLQSQTDNSDNISMAMQVAQVAIGIMQLAISLGGK